MTITIPIIFKSDYLVAELPCIKIGDNYFLHLNNKLKKIDYYIVSKQFRIDTFTDQIEFFKHINDDIKQYYPKELDIKINVQTTNGFNILKEQL